MKTIKKQNATASAAINLDCMQSLVRLAGFELKNNQDSLLLSRLIQLMSNHKVKEFNPKLLCDIHYSLFKGIIKNAGTLRKRDVVKDNSCCISFKLLKTSLKSALSQLERGKGKLMTRKEAAAAMCHFCRELLILSPFYEGSELAMNVLLWLFCFTCGLKLDFSKCESTLPEAQRLCLASDDVSKLYDCFSKAVSHIKPSKKPQPQLILSLPAPIKNEGEPKQIANIKASKKSSTAKKQKTARNKSKTTLTASKKRKALK